MIENVVMGLYSALLLAVLVLGAPYWLIRMMTSGRYRAGFWERLGQVSSELKAAVAGKQVVWVHSVSVGEVLAATRLVKELEAALGEGWIIVVSTTTATGQALARERFGANSVGRVFYYPLDFAWAVRAYLRALRPRMLVMMESEVWPRMLWECRRQGVPTVVVNARVSDRSFSRGTKVRPVWGPVLRLVEVFLAQSEEDARRLRTMGVDANSVRAIGNLKYDVRAPKASPVAEWIRETAAGRPIVVAGSTHEGGSKGSLSEEAMVVQAWRGALRQEARALLVLAPRHPERFGEVETGVAEFTYIRASQKDIPAERKGRLEVVLLDTIGDLAAVYGVANVAFVGGSLVKRGGHNPLEPAQFGVPVVMGPSYENFRGIVGNMTDAYAIQIVRDTDQLGTTLFELLTDCQGGKAMGERGFSVFAGQQGATARAVAVLVGLVRR